MILIQEFILISNLSILNSILKARNMTLKYDLFSEAHYTSIYLRKWNYTFQKCRLEFHSTSNLVFSRISVSGSVEICEFMNISVKLLIYIIKQDSHVYVPSSRPNGWTDWADFFLWTLRGGRGVKKNRKYFFQIFFSKFFFFNIFFSTGNAGPFS